MASCVDRSLRRSGPLSAHPPQRLLQLDVVREWRGGTWNLVLVEVTARDIGDALIEREVDSGAGAALGIEHDPRDEWLYDPQPSRQQIGGHDAWVQAVDGNVGASHAARERERVHHVGELRLRVGGGGPVAGTRVSDRGEVQPTAVVDPGSDRDDARRLVEVIRQQGGEQERTQVVGRERELEALGRGVAARAHHAGVVDQEPDRRVVAANCSSGLPHGAERGEIAADHLAPGARRVPPDLIAGGTCGHHVAAQHDDGFAGARELAARHAPDTVGGSRDDRELAHDSVPAILSSGWPMRITLPWPSPGASTTPAGAKAIMVEPCWNQPISSPLRSVASQGMVLGPRYLRCSSTSAQCSRMLATRIAATGTSVMR